MTFTVWRACRIRRPQRSACLTSGTLSRAAVHLWSHRVVNGFDSPTPHRLGVGRCRSALRYPASIAATIPSDPFSIEHMFWYAEAAAWMWLALSHKPGRSYLFCVPVPALLPVPLTLRLSLLRPETLPCGGAVSSSAALSPALPP